MLHTQSLSSESTTQTQDNREARRRKRLAPLGGLLTARAIAGALDAEFTYQCGDRHEPRLVLHDLAFAGKPQGRTRKDDAAQSRRLRLRLHGGSRSNPSLHRQPRTRAGLGSDGSLMGLISRRDLLRARWQRSAAESKRERLLRSRWWPLQAADGRSRLEGHAPANDQET